MATRKSTSKDKAARTVSHFSPDRAKQLSRRLEHDVAAEFHALLEIAFKFPSQKMLASINVRTITKALVRNVRSGFANISEQIPVAHPACVEIRRATIALDGITEFMRGLVGDGSGRYPMSEEAIGRCLYGFVHDAAAAFERTQKALGDDSNLGFLREPAGYYEARDQAREEAQHQA
jgi:hypothetical protein